MKKKSYRELNEEDKKYVIDYYYKFKNKSFIEISDMLLLSERSIARVLKEKGINTRRKNRYTLNEYYFENIDTEAKAYILGFIYADGYVGGSDTNNIVIAVNDKDILEKIANKIDFTGEIRKTNKGGFMNSKEGYSLNFYSEIMANSLRNLGLYPNKSLTMETIPQISDELMRHFIRGYFDGDGSVILSKNTSYHKVNGTVKKYEYKSFLFEILGTEKFLININSFMRLKYYKIRDTRTEQIKTLVCSSKKESKNIYNYLYNNLTIYLNRKYDKWNYILSAFAK